MFRENLKCVEHYIMRQQGTKQISLKLDKYEELLTKKKILSFYQLSKMLKHMFIVIITVMLSNITRLLRRNTFKSSPKILTLTQTC